MIHLTLPSLSLLISVSPLPKDFAPQGNPFRQPKKGDPKPKSMKMDIFPKNADGNGNFFKITYMNSGYLQANTYLKSQPLANRKNGFGTKDAFKTDEFTNGVRTQQYRESIKKEMNLQKEKGGKAYEELLAKYDVSNEDPQEKVNQFDIGRTRLTTFNPKSTKDTYYTFDEKNGKKMGMYRPVSCDVGSESWNHKYRAPENGGRSEVSKFYDQSHLTVNRTADAI